VTRHRKPLLLGLAAALFIWFNVAFFLWLGQGDTLAARLIHAWHAARSDWLVAATLNDAGIFVALALVWFWRDARARHWTRRRRVGWIVVTMVFGSPALLVYLAFRPTNAAPLVAAG
jgi:hypothetical protein